ncbi:hypothetical protein CAG70_00275 [Photobacterium halotolerans]|uniref:hypothetical protein n=1 Tax=Photobacterium halotolerans TaxID=265726 RepID=UPI0013733FFD|nr:hypothetical protein [Photobacterium halotolerans]NAX45446.1 hypothetical protein [Photobacterium halotolerans]
MNHWLYIEKIIKTGILIAIDIIEYRREVISNLEVKTESQLIDIIVEPKSTQKIIGLAKNELINRGYNLEKIRLMIEQNSDRLN